MAGPSIKPGIPIVLRELDPSSPLFKDGTSLRVAGKLLEYNVETAMAVIVDGSISLMVDTQHLRDLNFRVGCTFQFIGELRVQMDKDATLQARVGRNVDGMDLALYYQTLQLRRKFEADLKKDHNI